MNLTAQAKCKLPQRWRSLYVWRRLRRGVRFRVQTLSCQWVCAIIKGVKLAERILALFFFFHPINTRVTGLISNAYLLSHMENDSLRLLYAVVEATHSWALAAHHHGHLKGEWGRGMKLVSGWGKGVVEVSETNSHMCKKTWVVSAVELNYFADCETRLGIQPCVTDFFFSSQGHSSHTECLAAAVILLIF